MAWTTNVLIQTWVSADTTDLTAFDAAAKGSEAVKTRLLPFISLASMATWLSETTAPERVVTWSSMMGTALYLAGKTGLYLDPNEPDANQASRLYFTVEAEIQKTSYGGIVILDRLGVAVPINVTAQLTPRRFFDEFDTEDTP